MKEEVRQLLEKGERALRAAEILLKAGDAEFAAGRAYYAMLHAAQALLRQKDLQYHKHTGVHSAFGLHYAKTGVLDPKYHRWLLDAFDERIRGTMACRPRSRSSPLRPGSSRSANSWGKQGGSWRARHDGGSPAHRGLPADTPDHQRVVQGGSVGRGLRLAAANSLSKGGRGHHPQG